MAHQSCAYRLTRRYVPKHNTFIETAGRQHAAVRAKRQTRRGTLLPGETCIKRLSVHNIPQSYALRCAHGQQRPILVKSKTPDVLIDGKGNTTNGLPCLQVPDNYSAVHTAGRKQFAVGTEIQRVNADLVFK